MKTKRMLAQPLNPGLMDFPMKLSVYSIILMLFFAPLSRAAVTETVETLLNPFRYGSVFQSTFTNTDNPDQTTLAASLIYYYGWPDGLGVDFVLPLELVNNPPSTANASTPRLGGANNDRFQIDGYFRFWGNAANYLGLELGVGFPFQTDDALNGTSNNTWLIPLSLLVRGTLNPFALRGSVTENWSSPLVNPAPNGQSYVTEDNALSYTLYLSAFPDTTFSPYIRYTESFPTEKDTGVDTGSTSLLQKETEGSDTRTWGIGFDSIPFDESILFSAEGYYKVIPYGDYPWSWLVKMRWAF